MPARRRSLLLLLSVTVPACGDARVLEEAQQPEADAEDECPQWLLIERKGTFPSYDRRAYDDQARLIRRENGGVARSISGELHALTELSYENGLVTSESEARDGLGQEDIDDFTEVTELDELGRPVRILGWDSRDLPAPNRTVSHDYNQQGQLTVHHQQDEYSNGARVDRRCTFEYDATGQLGAKRCDGTHPDTRRYGWDENGNLLFSELQAETFTSRAEYGYDGTQLTSYLAVDSAMHEFAYDDQGRLVWHEYERFDGLGDGVDEYEYDAQGRVVRHTTAGIDGSSRGTTTFRFDARGRLIEAASELTPRSYSYEQSGSDLTVTERRGDEEVETRQYRCSPNPTTGMPVDTNPEPFGGRDRVLPHQTAVPLPFPETY